MTIARSCANCASRNQNPEPGEPFCWNLVQVIENYGTPAEMVRQPVPSDLCRRHQTLAEDLDKTQFIEAHRDELMAAICADAERQERMDQARSDLLASETSAERITRDLLRKFGKKP